MKRLIFVISLLFVSTAIAQEPMVNIHAAFCREILFQHVQPTPENIESIYCGYRSGFNTLNRNFGVAYDQFSTQDNIDVYRARKIAQLEKTCKEGERKSLDILQRDYPSFTINCSKYRGFDASMKLKTN